MTRDEGTLSFEESEAGEEDGAVAVGTELPPILPGQALGRFTLERRLGAGAMGEVWAARDAELDRPVAVKILVPRWSTTRARLRLMREAKALARLRHENIVTVFDVGEEHGRLYLAMELAEGDTLAAWMRAGPRPWREVRDVFLAAGRALAAAHAAGIVHRDFKPANLLVGPSGVRVVDFGLAASGDDGDPDSIGAGGSPELGDVPLTRTGKLVGTPVYMSPEQLRGERGSTRSDQWSFCVALFEALHGYRPFEGNGVAELVEATSRGARIASPPAGPPAFLRKILRRGLAAAPGDRYPSMDALVSELARGSRDRRRLAAGVLAVAALVSAGGGWWIATRSTSTSPGRGAAPRSVAVLAATTSDMGWIALAAERRVTAELLASGHVRVAPAELAAEHPAAAAVVRAGRTGDREALVRLARDLGVERTIVIQHEGASEDAVDVVATIYDARGEATGSWRESGKAAGALVLSERLAGTVREQLGLARPDSLASAQAALPRHPEAARSYAQGIALRRAFDLGGARQAFERARDLDPDAPLVHDALAEIWTHLGHEEHAAAESRRALELAAVLRHDERLRVGARAAVAAHEWDRAIEAYRALALLFPEEWDDAVAVVETMLKAARVHDAAAAIEALLRRDGATSDARVLLVHARVLGALRNHARAREAASEARARAAAVGLRGLVTRADEVSCLSAGLGGRRDEAIAACGRAISTHAASGNVVGEAAATANLAYNHIQAGRLDEARAVLDAIEPRIRRLGPSRALVSVLRTRANVEQKSSHNEKALALSREALAIARALGRGPMLAGALTSVASAELERERPELSQPLYEEAVAVAKQAGVGAQAAHALQNLALRLGRSGRLAIAKTTIDESIALFRQAHESFDIAWALDTAALIALDMNELARAEAFAREAIAVRTSNRLIAGQSRQNLAEVLLFKGDHDRAVAEAGLAVAEYRAQGHNSEVYALEVYARALLAKGEAGAALAAAHRALAIEDPDGLTYLRGRIEPTIARAKYALGDRRVVAEVERRAAGLSMDTSAGSNLHLALGELLAREGRSRRAREILARVIAHSKQAGQLLAVAEAERLLALTRR